MKLLFLTQVLDRQDGVLGFVVRWVEEFARHTEEVTVVALEVGDVSGLPANVKFVEIGRRGRIGRYLRYRRVLKNALVGEGYDAVLAHMVPRYALVAAGPAASAGARLYLWYTHKGVDERLRRAVPLVLKTFTASEESLRVETPNKVVTGHGIDTDHFDFPAPAFGADGQPVRLLSVGRLTPAKDPLTVLRALRRLLDDGHRVALDWVGGGLTKDDVGFAAEVAAELARLELEEHVVLHGEVPYATVDERFGAADILVNASYTGSVDKVVLEAMAGRRPVLSCNESFPPIFAELGPERAPLASFPHGDDAALAERVAALLALPVSEREQLGEDLRRIVVEQHGVAPLCERLIRAMEPGA